MPFYLVAWAVVQRPDGHILLGRRDGTGYGQGLWGLPGGRVERGEGLREAAARECHEEVSLQVNPEGLRALGVSRYDLGESWGTDFFFLATEWAGEPSPCDNTSEVGWFAPDHLPPDSLPWLPGALGAHLSGAWLTEQLSSEQAGAVRRVPG